MTQPTTSWENTYRELKTSDESGALDPDELLRFADAAWFMGHVDEATDALERAYLGYVHAGANDEAAITALRLTERAFRAGEMPVAQGWLAKAQRIVDDHPDSRAGARLQSTLAVKSLLWDGDPDMAVSYADRAIELARVHGDPDTEAIALSFKGTALTRLGRIEEGVALLDAATAAATSGELGAKTSCDVYCVTIATCHDVSDLRRSAEWTDRAERFMRSEAISGYPGACKVHRAEIKRYQGRWAEAEVEARAACEELERYRLLDILGTAYNEIGEVRLRMGDLDDAEAAFVKAYEYGWDPQPGLALLNLARGDAAEAARSLGRSLHPSTGSGGDVVHSVQRLPAKVEIDLAMGDLDGARAATEELERIVTEHQNAIWAAAVTTARGQVDLAEGQVDEALEHLDAAWRQWRQLEFPYESAQARAKLGEARRADGDEAGARLELNAALTVLTQLGAKREIRRVNDLLGMTEASAAVATMTFMFTDIVTSTDLIGLIGDEAWADLLAWHDRTLQAEFNDHGGEVINHTGDGFFVSFPDIRSALECAVDVQRRLRSQRREQGFAPSIRIGIHAGDATRSRAGYTGKGVHVAARIGAEASAEEILVSTATLAGLGDLDIPVSEPRSVQLKGVPDPVAVSAVEWR